MVLFVVKKKKSFLQSIFRGVKKHVKYLKKLGFDVDDTGRIKLTRNGKYAIDVVSRMIKEDDNVITGVNTIPLSNKIGTGGTKPDNSWKIEASKNFYSCPLTISSLYGSRQRGHQNSRKESIEFERNNNDCNSGVGVYVDYRCCKSKSSFKLV